MLRTDVKLTEVPWQEVQVGAIPAKALRKSGIPDCVFPTCTVMHQDASSSECAKCGCRTTKTCMTDSLRDCVGALELCSTGFMGRDWVCPLCLVLLRDGEDTWEIAPEVAPNANQPTGAGVDATVDVWDALKGIDCPNTRRVIEGLLKVAESSRAVEAAESEGLEGVDPVLLSGWARRMTAPMMQTLMRSALRERYGSGAAEPGATGGYRDHEVRVHMGVLNALLPTLASSEHARNVCAFHHNLSLLSLLFLLLYCFRGWGKNIKRKSRVRFQFLYGCTRYSRTFESSKLEKKLAARALRSMPLCCLKKIQEKIQVKIRLT